MHPLHKGQSNCCEPVTAEQNRNFVARRWQRPDAEDARRACCGDDIETLEGFLRRICSHSFTVTAMAFQDAGNLDLERLRTCSLHVYSDGRFVPLRLLPDKTSLKPQAAFGVDLQAYKQAACTMFAFDIDACLSL